MVLRICQGLAAGGEWGGAALIGVENAPGHKKALFGSFAQLGSPVGLVLATLVVLIVNSSMSEETFLDWGWRVPFLLSIVLIPVGLIIRTKVGESPEFEALQKTEGRQKAPLVQVLRHQRLQLLVGIGSFTAIFLTYYLMTSFMLAYAHNTLGMDESLSLPSNLIAAVVQGTAIVLAAVASVRIGTKAINRWSAVGLMVWAVPSFLLASVAQPWGMYVSVGVSMVFIGAAYGVLASDVSRLFTTDTRYTGVSLSYHLAAVLGGGLAPIAATAILEATGGNVFIIGLMPALGGLIMLICVLQLPRLMLDADSQAVGTLTTVDDR